MIDLDGFKKINDIFGHDSGDVLLCEIANRMRDIVPPSSIIARAVMVSFENIAYPFRNVWFCCHFSPVIAAAL
jgi:predicted signal transduction protein with EAL and GGDEF domain